MVLRSMPFISLSMLLSLQFMPLSLQFLPLSFRLFVDCYHGRRKHSKARGSCIQEHPHKQKKALYRLKNELCIKTCEKVEGHVHSVSPVLRSMIATIIGERNFPVHKARIMGHILEGCPFYQIGLGCCAPKGRISL